MIWVALSVWFLSLRMFFMLCHVSFFHFAYKPMTTFIIWVILSMHFYSINCSHIVVKLSPPFISRIFFFSWSDTLTIKHSPPSIPGHLILLGICLIWISPTLGIIEQFSFCFTWHNDLTFHPHYSMCESYLVFKGWIIFHCVYTTLCSSSYLLNTCVASTFWLLWIMLLWIQGLNICSSSWF